MSTIAAISTPHGVGGISIIRISGDNAFFICQKVFKSKSGISISNMQGYTVHFGTVYDLEGNLIDEVLLTVFKAPNSYTAENSIEISCHGGLTVSANVLNVVLSAGANMALPGEFTKRAFLNGKIDLSRAEAVIDLINADSSINAKAAIWQLEGAVSKKIEQIRQLLIEVNSEILAFVDYPDEDIADVSVKSLQPKLLKARTYCEKLIKSFESGSAIKDGIRCAIIGKPNAGKSSLMNILSKKEKSIVTHIAGTTRDIIEDTVILGGIKLILSDTAGVRDTKDIIEKLGVEKAFLEGQKSNLLLCVFDSNTKLTSEDLLVIEFAKDKKAIAVINKTDLDNMLNIELIKKSFKHIVYISALTGEGQLGLEKVISEMFIDGSISIENGELITNIRHKNCLNKANVHIQNAINALNNGTTFDAISVDICEALCALGEITGQTVNEQIIKDIFKRFCVGK